MGLLGALLPLQAPRHRGVAARANAGTRIRTVDKKIVHRLQGRRIDFPFQKNIHQLPQAEFIDCLHDLYFARSSAAPAGQRAPETQLQGDALGSLRPGHREQVPRPLQRKALRLRPGARSIRDAMGRFFPTRT